jgi:hypothetical protein
MAGAPAEAALLPPLTPPSRAPLGVVLRPPEEVPAPSAVAVELPQTLATGFGHSHWHVVEHNLRWAAVQCALLVGRRALDVKEPVVNLGRGHIDSLVGQKRVEGCKGKVRAGY